MNLDVRTIMLMLSGINLLGAGMMALISFHADNVRGARQWALGHCCMCIGIFTSTQMSPEWPLLIIAAVPLITGCGFGFIFNGIQAFKGKRCNYWITAWLGLQMMTQSLWFGIVQDDIRTVLIANSLLFSGIFAAGAINLMVKTTQPLKTAYWLAAGSFAFIALMSLLRALNLFLTPAHGVGLFAQGNVNPIFLVLGGLSQLSISLSLVLLITFRLVSDLREQASYDSLTGAMNRRRFEDESRRLLARAIRTGEPLSIIMIDVDFFKRINDRHGHPAGDEVLRRLSKLLQAVIRSEDCLARYGGEEFCILLVGTREQGAAQLAERVRLLYADLRIEWKNEILQSTLSAGVADSSTVGTDLSTLVGAADQALYRAKNAGRNCIALHSMNNQPLPS
ncbi:GGDEF domain-containing protein [Undibacterium sp. CY18W]|uniref:diguanylate cyclase n=1 Tax=Undibacterium hunanense TaxID=2762292 RepID=A0ABR6ZRN2_9BURK|nr:GGDEF domain-containing protein [Undibacterium hunanense]MBC3918498.1 GGDEF domain-containing protein [Undibacterium hunanense]